MPKKKTKKHTSALDTLGGPPSAPIKPQTQPPPIQRQRLPAFMTRELPPEDEKDYKAWLKKHEERMKKKQARIDQEERKTRVAREALEKKKRKKALSQDPRFCWPKSKKLPQFVVKARRRPQPCPRCRRLRLDDGGQAVICTSSRQDIAWFRCQNCRHRWSLPVKRV